MYATTNRDRQFTIAVQSIVIDLDVCEYFTKQFFSSSVKLKSKYLVSKFSYLATLLFRHVALCIDHAIIPFHSPLRASFQVRLRGTKNKPCFQVLREGTLQVPIKLFATFALQCLTLQTKPASMVDGKHMPDCGVIGNETNK